MAKFTNKAEADSNVITVPSTVDRTDIEELRGQIKNWLLLPVELHILDCHAMVSMATELVPVFIAFKNALKGSGKHLFSIHMDKEIRRRINSDGLANVFSPVDSIYEAKKRAGLKVNKQGIDVEFINPFLTAAIDALKIQTGIEAKPAKPYIKTPGQKFDIGIAGIIGISTSRFSGNITLCFPAQMFLKLYELVFNETHQTINGEIEDFAGEMLNIVYGQAKIVLNDKLGHSLSRALPTVMTGSAMSVRQVSGSVTVILPFETSIGNFHLEIEKLDNAN